MSFQKLHQKLAQRNQRLIKKLDEPPVEEELAKFAKVSGLVLREQTKTRKNMHNPDACQISCSIDRECKSFSYNSEEKVCLLSKRSLRYTPDSTFYAKQSKVTGGVVKYSMYPGLYADASAGMKTTDQTKEQCELACSQVVQCRGFSFKESSGECARTLTKLDYDNKWDYYEKPARAHENGDPQDLAFHRDQDKLNERFNHFWGEYEYNHRDMSKIVDLSKQADKIKADADALEPKMRADQLTMTRYDAKAADAKRRASRIVDLVRNTNKEYTEAKGDVQTAETELKLTSDKLDRLNEKIAKETAEMKKGKSLSPEEVAKAEAKARANGEAREKLDEDVTAKRETRDKAISRSKMLEARIASLEDEQRVNDKDQLDALAQRKATHETYKGRVNKLKMLAIDAKQVKKLVDAEIKKDVPPSFQPIDTSVYATSWNQKVSTGQEWIQKDNLARREEEANQEGMYAANPSMIM